MVRPVKPGDPLKGNITANWFNEVNRKLGKQRPQLNKSLVSPHGEYFILDESYTVVVEQYQPVVITDQVNPVSTEVIDKQEVMLKCKEPAEGVHSESLWAITQDTVVGNTTPGRLVAVGVTWAKFTMSDEDHKYVKLDETTHTLISTSDQTKASIISFNGSVPGPGYGLILIVGGAGSSSVWSRFTLTSDLAATVGATATALFQDASTGTVVNTGTWRAFTGAIGVAVLVNDIWSIISVQEPADFLVEMGDNSPIPDYPTPNTTASIYPVSKEMLTLYPNDFDFDLPSEVANPLLLNSHDGDIGTVRWDKEIDEYILTHVAPAKQKMFWAKLTADCPLGLYANVDITPLDLGHLGNGEYDSATRTADEYPQVAVDLFNKAHNAKENHKCLVVLDPDAGTYKILECDHIATHWLGTVYVDFSGTPATFEVEFVKAYNGQDVSGVTIEIENRWSYKAMKAGDKVDILYDPESGVWYPMENKATPQTDVRVKPDGTALQKSFDGGTTWIDFATIGACP